MKFNPVKFIPVITLLVGPMLALGVALTSPAVSAGTAMAEAAASNRLPDINVAPITLGDTSAYEALRAVLDSSGAGIGLAYPPSGLPAALRRRVSAANVAGPLPTIVAQLAAIAGFSWRYDPSARVLTVMGTAQGDNGFMAMADGAAAAATDRADGRPGAAVAAATTYSALLSDGTVRSVVNRWSRDNGMQSVVWEIGNDDIPVDREVSFSGDFDAALTGLMQATSFTAHPARACIHANGVVRIIPRTQFCE